MIYSNWFRHAELLARPYFRLQPRAFGARKTVLLNGKDRRLLSYHTRGSFIDRIVLTVSGGRGGTGCLSFSRAPNQEFAPPDGGNGGNGGSVWLRVDPDCTSLRQSTTILRAASGSRGKPAKRRGSEGDDLFVPVPPGTIVYEFCSYTPSTKSLRGAEISDGISDDGDDAHVEIGDSDNDSNDDNGHTNKSNNHSESSNEDDPGDVLTQKGNMIPLHKLTEKQWDTLLGNLEATLNHLNGNGEPYLSPETQAKGDKILVAELNLIGENIQVAAGGRGGRGNAAYKSSTNRTPMQADQGAPGETRRLELVLKTIADVGLVGFPNAGKSTLLRAISHAKPKVAAYPFTTLRPHIGVMSTTTQTEGKFYPTLTVADIPGLIEGAHEDRGLGHDFLRHIERTSFLVYVIDVAGFGSVDPCKAFDVLRKELELHSPGLSFRAGCVVANKMDGGEQARKNLVRLIAEVGDKFAVFPVSAKFGVGVKAVVHHLSENVVHSSLGDGDDVPSNIG